MATNDSVPLPPIKVYRAIGLDSEGRSHHYSPDDHEIVVADGDYRGQGIKSENIEQRIEPSPDSTGAWDYIQFVRDEVDGLTWAETNVPEEDPEK